MTTATLVHTRKKPAWHRLVRLRGVESFTLLHLITGTPFPQQRSIRRALTNLCRLHVIRRRHRGYYEVPHLPAPADVTTLTAREARVWVAAVKFGVSSAKVLAGLTGIKRQDVSACLETFVKRGDLLRTIPADVVSRFNGVGYTSRQRRAVDHFLFKNGKPLSGKELEVEEVTYGSISTSAMTQPLFSRETVSTKVGIADVEIEPWVTSSRRKSPQYWMERQLNASPQERAVRSWHRAAVSFIHAVRDGMNLEGGFGVDNHPRWKWFTSEESLVDAIRRKLAARLGEGIPLWVLLNRASDMEDASSTNELTVLLKAWGTRWTE